MSQNKTVATDASVADFINAVDDEVKRADSWKLVEIMTQITGFSPRKTALTLYINGCDGWEANADLMDSLGKHKVGKGCLYIKRLSDVDLAKLTELIERGAQAYS